MRRELRDEIQEVEKGVRGEANRHFARLEDKIDRRSDIAPATMLSGFVGLMVTHFIG